MTEEDCEALALEVSRDSGLDDRPYADPSVIAVAWAGLRLRPEPGATPHLVAGTIVYPASASPPAVAYFVGHELGHDIIHWAGEVMDRELEEECASRIGTALILPRRPFLRDLRAVGRSVSSLRELWPLATPWVIARRIAELTGGSAAMFGPGGRRMKHVGRPLEATETQEIDGVLIAIGA